ncbi:hypothetical protein [Cysteiniphilum sp. JM-1]|uniref:hypothetical protein n=1 Tax=Cysteiniphilum sp. JM-1 TaxID=2610891 RepID=UPI001248CFBB|nr:hypothetical protein [Cysteiniphilum sp. JM-1]
MKRILLALLISIVVLMQQSYADDGSGRQVFELMFTMDPQSQPEIKKVDVEAVKDGDLEKLNTENHYLLWNNNQETAEYKVTLTLNDDSQFVFYLNPFWDNYANDYPNGTSYNYGLSWMLGIWNSAKQSINQSNLSYNFKSYSGRYYIDNSLLKHMTLNVYETVRPVIHGQWQENSDFMPAADLHQFNACDKHWSGQIDDNTLECMINPNDQKKYQMYFVTVNIANLFMGNAKEYLLGFAHNNGMISWQQKSEQDYGKDGSATNKLYFQASYNQQPFCKVYMSDDLSSITSVEQIQYAPISCSYQSDYYEPKFIFACSGSSSLGMTADNQSACGWINNDNIQSQAFSSNINQL